MKIHPNFLLPSIDVNIGRGKVAVACFHILQFQSTRPINAPRAFETIGVSEPEIGSVVTREIQVISSERALHPFRNTNEGGTIYVGADSRIRGGRDYGAASEANCARRRSGGSTGRVVRHGGK